MAAEPSSGRQSPQAGSDSTTVRLPTVAPPSGSSRYKMLKLHAQGGMGEIWLAEDQHIGRQVAFKRIRAGREQLQERFFVEAQVTGQLEHPGIVPVHELGKDENAEPFYVMRLVQGRTLKEVIADSHAAKKRGDRDQELRFLRLLQIFVALCRTMSYAHARGVIHRDLKPDNVMIGRFGETLVVDWGLCRISGHPEAPVTESVVPVKLSSGQASTATQDGEIIGSPPYMSPEMALGHVGEEDAKTDVYLLGATLYEIMTGRPPRLGSSKQEIIDLARTAPPAPPRTVDPRIPKALEAVCLKAMAHRKEDRYQSAEQVADEIERYIAGDAVAAYPEPLTDRAWRWIIRHRTGLTRAVTAAAVLTVMATGFMALQSEIERRKEAEVALAQRKGMAEAAAEFERFRSLDEEMRSQLADSLALSSTLIAAEPGPAERTWQEIATLVRRWEAELAEFAPPEKREALKKEYVELLLWRAQNILERPTDVATANQLLAELEGIAKWAPPLASYHRLRSDCLLRVGKPGPAEQALEHSQIERRNATAFDFFLEGEQQLVKAMGTTDDAEERTLWRVSSQPLQRAIIAYDQCLQLEPQHFWGRLQKGRCRLVLGQPAVALADFDAAVALRPQSASAWTLRGLAHAVRNSNSPAAVNDLNHALKLKDSFTTRLHRGAVHLLRADYPQARQDLLEALKLSPGDSRATYYLALLKYQQNQLAPALADCNTVLQQSPTTRPARLLRVQISLSQVNQQQAAADLAVLTAAAGDAAHQAAAQCELLMLLAPGVRTKAGRQLAFNFAEQQGLSAVEGGVKAAELFRRLGMVQYSLGKLADAIATFSQGLATDASPVAKARLHNNRGHAFAALEDFDRAKEDFSAAAAIPLSEPGARLRRIEAHSMLGFVAAKQSSPALAERESALAMAEMPGANHYAPWIYLGCTYAVLSEADAAQSPALQDQAMTMLSNALLYAAAAGPADTAKAKQMMSTDPALTSLHERRDYRNLISPPATN